jgi:hypothetical protein
MRYTSIMLMTVASVAMAQDGTSPIIMWDQDEARNATWMRQMEAAYQQAPGSERPRFDRGVSLYGDLRRDLGPLKPAYGLPTGERFQAMDMPTTILSIDWSVSERVHPSYSPAVTFPTSGQFLQESGVTDDWSTEVRHDMSLLWRQHWSFMPFITEVEITGSYRNDDIGEHAFDGFHLGDPIARVVWQAWEGRTSAIALSLGCSFPVGTEDVLISHGTFTPEVGVRGSIGFFNRLLLAMDVKGQYTSWAEMDFGDRLNGDVPLEYLGIDGSIAATWRFTPYFRAGLMQKGSFKEWTTDRDFGDFSSRNQHFPTCVIIELTPLPGLSVTGHAGMDMLSDDGDMIPSIDSMDRLDVGASLSYAF